MEKRPKSRRSRRRPFAFGGILLIFAFGAGALEWQMKVARKHLPRIEAELAESETEGPSLLNAVGTSPDSTPYSEGTKTFPSESRRSHWQGTRCRVTWRQVWESPGDHGSVEDWYRARLAEQGWRPFERGVPSPVQKQFWKGKWLLTLQRQADFSADREPRGRYGLVLEWDYWHRLGDG